MTQTGEKTDLDEPTLEVQATPAPVKPPLLQLWYHESDLELLQPINPFFLHLQRRLPIGTCLLMYKTAPVAPKLFDNTEYFRQRYEENLAEYKRKKQAHEEQHQAEFAESLAGLPRTTLFVPCVSPVFLEALDKDLAASPELAQALENPHFQIMPLLIRPTETGASVQSRPLCTYAEGHERDTALKELVGLMEVLLCNALHIEPRTTAIDYLFCSPQTVQPVIASQTSMVDRVLAALEPVNDLVKQASAQIVEARQLALNERSEQPTMQTLAQEVEALRRQLAQPSSFWSRLFRKKQGE